MIKVGQIYKTDVTETIFVITYICGDYAYFVTNVGYADERKKSLVEQDVKSNFAKLIAEYPTWREAVNSPEFKGEK